MINYRNIFNNNYGYIIIGIILILLVTINKSIQER